MRERKMIRTFLILLFLCVLSPVVSYTLGTEEPVFSVSMGVGVAAFAMLASVIPALAVLKRSRSTFFLVFLGMIPVRLVSVCALLAALLWFKLIEPFAAVLSMFVFYVVFMTLEIVFFCQLQRNQEG